MRNLVYVVSTGSAQTKKAKVTLGLPPHQNQVLSSSAQQETWMSSVPGYENINIFSRRLLILKIFIQIHRRISELDFPFSLHSRPSFFLLHFSELMASLPISRKEMTYPKLWVLVFRVKTLSESAHDGEEQASCAYN